ncbi:polysaccharide deacetylase family protein [Magnetospirillum sp. 64-120]|uniref:polysaccharide deacetylase family protein n=1 Tax=Magnetospirillum sp. 64-120 TaxID=1895778 RepID=UPI0025C15CE0|nr:polysaccharide deacetylase family protein [Magnetospirillum sp. 64-120]
MISSDRDRYNQIHHQALRGFSGRVSSELTILLYHGVFDGLAPGIANYNGKHVPVDQFRDHMRFIHDHCAVLTMDEVAEIAASGKPWPRRAVAVTFDDGFSNNRTLAADVLVDSGVPATFYVCPGLINTTMMFWVDQLEDCLNRSLRAQISVVLDGIERCFIIDGDEKRIEALDTIKSVCKRVPLKEKTRILQEVSDATGILPTPDAWSHYRPATWKEIRELADESLFIVGGHSLYHDILALQGDERAAQDIHASLRLLEYQLEMPIRHYSYPEGQKNHFNDSIISTLKSEGVVSSPSAILGLNPVGSDPFHLRRIMVGFYGTLFPFLDPALA